MFALKIVAIATFVFLNFSIIAVGHGSFSNIKSRVEKEGFSDRKLAILKSEASRTTFTADQVAELMDLFSFSSDKIKALTSLRNRIEDPENAYVIVERFPYDSDKKNAANLLDGIESALPKPPRTSKRTVCWGEGPGRYCYTEYIEQ
ncbi:DUF4476 domain-containing protein [Leptospira adleri]|uniref:DUF4476 domain-containing protein n=1 Tax=Leptospira adleri TaxID=2023186 RepID=A0A2M9YQL8_9LEPT|nr:DUF4476 domain-containing protein [Leptospira adleri]PJZ53827.1 hypothetical protein CH380_07370 [Leptospira adleri]PJZ63155.1 hypothetical protein CH376_04755 [Leptospira adleri]TGM60276.1 DUF4476 domain-containing protein [Leptospira adleri]